MRAIKSHITRLAKAGPRLSTYPAFAAWGSFAFMAHPAVASLICFAIGTVLFWTAIQLARRDGKKETLAKISQN